MADRTTLGPIRGAAAAAPGLRSDAPTAVPPPPRQRSDRVRQAAIADTTCSATTIRNRRDEWTRLGVFAQFTQIGLQSYDRIVELVLDQIAIDGSITKAPGGGEDAGGSPVDRGKQGLKRSGMTDSYGIPSAGSWPEQTATTALLAPILDLLHDLGPLPDDITVHLDAGYASDRTRAELSARKLHGRIARKGKKTPIQASQRWHVERTRAWQNAFHGLARCYERRATVIDAFFDLADTIITVRSLIRGAWTTHRWDDRPNRHP
ncbi:MULTISPECIES: transposase [Streptomyces]|uniref:transposase n=1 Tax=Streptomyces TaxID=1883 RepID=UPI00362EAC43